MPHHKHQEHLTAIKEAIKNTDKLSEEEKSNALAHVEEWREEDKGFGMFIEELVEKFAALKPILADIGLI